MHAGGDEPAGHTERDIMILDYNTHGPPTAEQSAAHVAALAAITAAGFTPSAVFSFFANGHIHAASVETAPGTHGHPAFEIAVPVES